MIVQTLNEHIRKYPIWYGFGWFVLLGFFSWLIHSWSCSNDYLWIAWGWVRNFGDWLRKTPDKYESGSTTVRNLGLILAGLIALPLTLWRIRVADRQAKAAHRQVETSQRSLLNEEYQKGAEMLGSEVLSVRLGGIYALARLARQHPAEYHVQIMRLFCTFVRHPTKDQDEKNSEKSTSLDSETKQAPPRADIQAVMEAIKNRGKDAAVALEPTDGFMWNLESTNLNGLRLDNVNLFRARLGKANLVGTVLVGADLSGSLLAGADLSNAHLFHANLLGAVLDEANLTNAKIVSTNLKGADLRNSNLCDAMILYANLSYANLSGATGLTQAQLDEAIADPNNPPTLSGVFDAETGEQLLWRGGPLDEDE